MSKGQKRFSAYGKFAKSQEHARWAIDRRKQLQIEALEEAEKGESE